jgi:hypothetical protein
MRIRETAYQMRLRQGGRVAPGDALAPDCIFVLMTGQFADARLLGWVDWYQSWRDDASLQRVLTAAWRVQGEALTAEAARHGFQPHALTHSAPTGDGFRDWEKKFLGRFIY